MPDATRAPGAALPPFVRDSCPTNDLLDDVLDAAMTAHAHDEHDTRLLSAVVRDTLADPAHRALVGPWLAEVGLIGGAS